MNKEQLDYIERNIDNAEAIGALSFGWADNVRELVREMRKDQRVLSTIIDVLSVTVSTEKLNSENARQDVPALVAEVRRLRAALEYYADIKGNDGAIARIALKGGEG